MPKIAAAQSMITGFHSNKILSEQHASLLKISQNGKMHFLSQQKFRRAFTTLIAFCSCRSAKTASAKQVMQASEKSQHLKRITASRIDMLRTIIERYIMGIQDDYLDPDRHLWSAYEDDDISDEAQQTDHEGSSVNYRSGSDWIFMFDSFDDALSIIRFIGMFTWKFEPCIESSKQPFACAITVPWYLAEPLASFIRRQQICVSAKQSAGSHLFKS